MTDDIRRFAGADWAFVRDSSALAIVEGDEQELKLIALHEWRGKRDPREVVPAAAALLRKYGCESVMSDRHYSAFVDRELDDAEISWVAAPITQDEIWQTYLRLRMLLASGQLKLNGGPNAVTHLERLKAQLQGVRSKPVPGGGERIELSTKDGSHSDLVSALVLAVWQAPTVAQDGTFIRLPSRVARYDHRYASQESDMAETSEEFEERDDFGEPLHEPLIACG